MPDILFEGDNGLTWVLVLEVYVYGPLDLKQKHCARKARVEAILHHGSQERENRGRIPEKNGIRARCISQDQAYITQPFTASSMVY